MLVDDERAKLDLQDDYKMVKHIILLRDKHDAKHGGKGILIGMKDYVKLDIVRQEHQIFQKLDKLIDYYNPDIFMAYEIRKMSISYLMERYRHKRGDVKDNYNILPVGASTI